MGKIRQGSSTCVAVFGVICLILGIALSACTWILNSKFSDVRIYKNALFSLDIRRHDDYKTFPAYWWGGLVYCVPALFGIIGGCTRNVCMMVLYMIFNILCLLCSVVVCVFVAILFVFWYAVHTLLQSDVCTDTLSKLINEKLCLCQHGDTTFAIVNATCSDIKVAQFYLLAILGLAAVSSILAFIASYVSCCSLCNQENDPSTTIVIHPAQMNQNPHLNIVNNHSIQQVGSPAYNIAHMTTDHSNLLKNQYPPQ